jgi:hypothetical protein
MTDQHRATPEQWRRVTRRAKEDKSSTDSCLLELCARIEALEAAQLEQAESHRFCTDAIVRRVEALEATQQDKLDRLIALDREDPTPNPTTPEPRPASAEAQPAGGLVERVAGSIWKTCDLGIEARAAIREVAAAARLRDLNGQSVAVMTWEMVAQWLEQEANQ